MGILEIIKTEIVRRIEWLNTATTDFGEGRRAEIRSLLDFLDSLPEQPVTDHHEIEVEFRGEKVTVNREFYRDGEMNYSTSEQDDNVIWAALRAWCEKKGITAFELYPEQPEQPVEGLEEEIKKWIDGGDITDTRYDDYDDADIERTARHFAEWGKNNLK